MTITGYGFDGTLNEFQFAKLMNLAGLRYAVGSTGDFAAFQVSGVRSVSISEGDAYAPGVLATATTSQDILFAAPTAGQWHLIVLRRTWAGTSGVCELVAVAGATTSSTLPTVPPTSYPTINSTPGVVDDQPLYWAWVNVTNTTVTLFDLRRLPISDQIKTYKVADATARELLAGMTEGDIADQADTNETYRYSGTAWAPIGPKVMSTSGKTSAMPATAQPIFKSERVAATTGSNGGISITFPTAFPNGVSSIFFSLASGAASTLVLNGDALTVSGCNAVAPGTPSASLVFYYFAIGW